MTLPLPSGNLLVSRLYHGHHEVPLGLTMRNLMVNINFDLPDTTRKPLGLTVRFLMATMRFLLYMMRNLMVNVNFDLPPTMREPLGLTVRFLLVSP